MAASVIAVATSLIDAVNILSKTIQAGTSLVGETAEFVDVTASAVSDNIEKCKALHAEKIDCGGWERKVFRDLKRVFEKAFVYASIVDQLNHFGGDRVRNKKIRKKLLRGNLTELTVYISQLQKFVVKCIDSYQGTQEAINELISRAQDAAAFCEERAVKANMQKKASRVVGGTATAAILAGGAAGGVTLSIVAGAFTFGIGTIVGLSLTAAGLAVSGAAVGTATGVATHLYASDRMKLESDFRTLGESFLHVQVRATRIEDFINALQTLVKLISNAIDDATQIDTYEDTTALTSALVVAFDCVCETFGHSYEASTTYRQQLMAMNSDLRARFNELHIR